MENASNKSSVLTQGMIDETLESLAKDGSLFRCDAMQLARHIAAKIGLAKSFVAPWHEIRRVLENGCRRSAPNLDDSAFLLWFLNEVLDLRKTPKDALVDLYNHASEDLASIQSNIMRCDAEMATISGRKVKTGDDEQDHKFYLYFKELNVEARDEICTVLASDMQNLALTDSRGYRGAGFGGSFIFRDLFSVPWSFRGWPHRFDPGEFSELRYKFLSLPLSDWYEIDHIYNEDPSQFRKMIVQYFKDHQPIKYVRTACDKNPWLKARRDILLPAMEAFDREEYALFCSAIAPQIEGIFEDCCLELGEDPNQLHSATLRPKLDLLKKSRQEFNYPYYAFRFAKIRNRIAHGKLLPGENVIETAQFILLDLVHVIGFNEALESPRKQMRELLGVNKAEANFLSILKFASLLAKDVDAPHPDYELQAQYDAMLRELDERGAELWQYARSLAESANDDILTDGLRNVAIAMKKRQLSKNAAQEFLKSCSGSKEKLTYDHAEFWSSLESGERCRSQASQ